MISQLTIEDLTHLVVYDFPINGEKHHTQAEGTPTKVILLFSIASTEHEAPVRLAAVRIPRALPLYRVRTFVTHAEDKLREIYGKVKRNNIVFTAPENSDTWDYETTLPMHGIFYA